MSAGRRLTDRRFTVRRLCFLTAGLHEELVGWLNQMDTTYRSELRELNELNFARFDAKLEQRLAQLDAKMSALRADMIKWMFVFWAGNVGILLALFQYFRP